MRTQNIIAATTAGVVAIALVIMAACNSNGCDIPDLTVDGHMTTAKQSGERNPEGDLWRCHVIAAWDKHEVQIVGRLDDLRENAKTFDFYGYQQYILELDWEPPSD